MADRYSEVKIIVKDEGKPPRTWHMSRVRNFCMGFKPTVPDWLYHELDDLTERKRNYVRPIGIIEVGLSVTGTMTRNRDGHMYTLTTQDTIPGVY